jgi:hypothetical protein
MGNPPPPAHRAGEDPRQATSFHALQLDGGGTRLWNARRHPRIAAAELAANKSERRANGKNAPLRPPARNSPVLRIRIPFVQLSACRSHRRISFARSSC